MYKIISDGTARGTKVLYNSEELKRIMSIALNCSAEGVTANIEVLLPKLDIELEDNNVRIN